MSTAGFVIDMKEQQTLFKKGKNTLFPMILKCFYLGGTPHEIDEKLGVRVRVRVRVRVTGVRVRKRTLRKSSRALE